MIYEVPLKSITKENISEFGQLFNVSDTVPTYSDSNFDWWNEVGFADLGESASFGIVKPKFNPEFSETVFEQHSNTPEVLIPVDEDIIVLVAKKEAFSDGLPKLGDFEAFMVPKGTAVSLKAGVWHHAPMVKGVASRVFVIFKDKTSFVDCVTKDLKPVGLTIKVKC